MQLDEILERNRKFVLGRAPEPLPPAATRSLAVIACYDPRLDTLLLSSLGIRPGDAFLLRFAGALIRPSGEGLRSVGLAVFMFGVTELLVVGHSSCRMAKFESSRFIDSFRARGVRRDAFGHEDLREWSGAIASPRMGIRRSVSSIQTAPFIPTDVNVAGLLLDDSSGALEVVVQPGETVSGMPTDATRGIEPPPETERTAEEVASEGESEASAGESRNAAARAAQVAQSKHPDAVEQFVHALLSKKQLAQEAIRLRKELSRVASPWVKFGLVESYARRLGVDSREILQAFERVKQEAKSQLGDEAPNRVLQQIQRLLERKQ